MQYERLTGRFRPVSHCNRPRHRPGGFLEPVVLFLVVAVVAVVVDASGVTGLSVEIARWLVVILVVLAVMFSPLSGVVGQRAQTPLPAGRDRLARHLDSHPFDAR